MVTVSFNPVFFARHSDTAEVGKKLFSPLSRSLSLFSPDLSLKRCHTNLLLLFFFLFSPPTMFFSSFVHVLQRRRVSGIDGRVMIVDEEEERERERERELL